MAISPYMLGIWRADLGSFRTRLGRQHRGQPTCPPCPPCPPCRPCAWPSSDPPPPELGTCHELRYRARRNLQRSNRGRVLARACRTLGGPERPETDQLNGIAFFDGGLDGVDQGVQKGIGSGLGKVVFGREDGNEICAVHGCSQCTEVESADLSRPRSLRGRRHRSETCENRGSRGAIDKPRVGPWAQEVVPRETGLSRVAADAPSVAQTPS